jgi:multiple sugar transport system substrate-binding protein
MNDMIDEFNNTVGKEKGVVLAVTSVSNSTDIHDALLASANHEAGAGALPDLFFCYPETAGAIDAELLINWNDAFTKDELSAYVPAFLDEGTVDGKLLVFPVAKSSEALFVNTTIFDRFSAATGVGYDSLATWDGLFAAADEYYAWSGGKSLVMHDELLNFVQINTAALGGTAFKDGKLNFDDPIFKAEWLKAAQAAISGRLYVEEGYETTRMMTGDIVCGIGSTASVMYFQDTVTYADNTKEPLVLKALPCPVAAGGEKRAMQQGVGLCAASGDAKKNAAALLFAKWITQGEPNLRFAVSAGYMPVQNAAFDGISDYPFESDAYRSLYEAMKTMRDSYTFYLPPVVDGYYDILNTFYDSSVEILTEGKASFDAGNGTAQTLAEESFEKMRDALK